MAELMVVFGVSVIGNGIPRASWGVHCFLWMLDFQVGRMY